MLKRYKTITPVKNIITEVIFLSKKKKNKNKNIIDLTNLTEDMVSIDENGSYTGVTNVKGEKPVQDADDL